MKIIIKRILVSIWPVLAILFSVKNRVRAHREWVIVLGGASYARDLTRELNALGYKVFLFDSTPKAMNWRFASRTRAIDVYNQSNILKIVTTARNLGVNFVLMQSDDNLIPVYAKVNTLLKNEVTFSETAIKASLDKAVMRQCLNLADLRVPVWGILKSPEDVRELTFPAIVKPLEGQGSKGVVYVTKKEEALSAMNFARTQMGQDKCIYEEFIEGRQFNIEGVLLNGTPFFHMITEECFTDFLPEFKPCWYLFAVDLTPEMEQEVLREARDVLAACDFQSGAFHVELKLRGQHAFAFDLSNRMPADFPRYAQLTLGTPAFLDYLNAMQNRELEQRSLKPQRYKPMLRYYNYDMRPERASILALAESLAARAKLTLIRNGDQLEMTAEEPVLRTFLKDVYALRDHNRH